MKLRDFVTLNAETPGFITGLKGQSMESIQKAENTSDILSRLGNARIAELTEKVKAILEETGEVPNDIQTLDQPFLDEVFDLCADIEYATTDDMLIASFIMSGDLRQMSKTVGTTVSNNLMYKVRHKKVLGGLLEAISLQMETEKAAKA